MPAHKFNRDVENLIANLRGLPENESRSKLRDTRSLDNVLEHVMQKYHVGQASPEQALQDRWGEVVGDSNTDFCHPLRVDRGTSLVIGVANPVVRQALQFSKDLILSRVRTIPGCTKIKRLIFRAG